MADDINGILRSPRQASQIFGLEGARPPRQKNLFVVNFRKAGDNTSAGLSAGTWNKDLGFIVKSVDRPSIEPKVEEIIQYNKKRQINTGFKIGSTRLTIYDTADSMAMRMWAEYSKFYFGDFRHYTQASTDWSYDVTLETFQDTASGGYGFAPQAASSSEAEYNSQFFLETISIYQVFGGKYVRMDLVHPKITSFAPDNLDYSQSDVGTYTMTVACEAVLYANDHQPQPLSGDAFLSEAFSSTSWYDGDTNDVPAGDLVQSFSYPSSTDAIYPGVANPSPYTYDYAAGAETSVRPYTNSFSTGSLNAYGSYDFGAASPQQVVSDRSVASDLSVAALTNPALASALSLSSAVARPTNSAAASTRAYAAPTFISQNQLDVARSAVTVVGGGLLTPGQQTDGQIRAILDAATYGALAAGLALETSEREQIYNRHRPQEADINSWNSASGTGLTLSSQACGIMNGQRPPTSQIGFNLRNATSPAPTGGRRTDFDLVKLPAHDANGALTSDILSGTGDGA